MIQAPEFFSIRWQFLFFFWSSFGARRRKITHQRIALTNSAPSILLMFSAVREIFKEVWKKEQKMMLETLSAQANFLVRNPPKSLVGWPNFRVMVLPIPIIFLIWKMGQLQYLLMRFWHKTRISGRFQNWEFKYFFQPFFEKYLLKKCFLCFLCCETVYEHLRHIKSHDLCNKLSMPEFL